MKMKTMITAINGLTNINYNSTIKNMAKRICTRKGNVFCVELHDLSIPNAIFKKPHKRFFQYVANDMTELNSDVIRVFKKRYPMDYEPVIDEIISDEVDFYVHTIVSAWVKEEFCYRVGTTKDVGDIENIKFIESEDYGTRVEKSYNWYIWTINEKKVYIGPRTGEYVFYNLGGVAPNHDVVHKLITGEFLFKYPGF